MELWASVELGPIIRKRFGKPATVEPGVGLDAVGLPELGEPDAVLPDDVLGVRGLGGLEAGAHDDHVDRAGDAVLAHHLVGGERGHR